MKLHMPKNVYASFYHLLELKVRTRLKEPEGKTSSKMLWELLNGNKAEAKDVSVELFGDTTWSKERFYRPIKDWAGLADPFPFDRYLFCNALKFIGFKLHDSSNAFDDDERLQTLGTAFLQENFPHLTVDIFYGKKAERSSKTTSKPEESIANAPLFQSLNNSVFVSEYTQGSRIDRAYFTFTTIDQDKISGKMFVNYQGEDDTYINPKFPDNLSVLDIEGYFLYEDVLVFTFINSKDRVSNRHAGVMKLEYSDHDKFSGKYLVKYFKSPPPKRRNTIHGIDDLGDIEINRCRSVTDAKKFVLFQDDETKKKKLRLTYRNHKIY